jgi:sulfatase modifying factor 1
MSPSLRLLIAASCALLFACGERPAALDGEAPGPSVTSLPPGVPVPAAVVARSPCPDEMAQVETSCVDRYEAHLVIRGPHGELAPHPHYLRPEEGVVYEARSEPGVFPQAYISRVESEAACAAAGKRLCSRSEWQRACSNRREGRPGTTYPYGASFQPKRCNAEKAHLLTLLFGADPTRWRYAQFNDPILSQEPGFLAETGAYDGCVGDAGVYDLVGNLHEWVSDVADSAFEARLRGEGIARSFQYWSPGNAVFMGGFYSTHGELGPGCTFTTVAHEARYHDYSTGFRCCADASP